MRPSLIILTILLILAASNLNSIHKRNYVASPYYTISVFKNFKGLYDWKRDFTYYYRSQYNSVKLRYFDDLLLKLKNDIKQKIFYIRNSANKKNYTHILIPVISFKEGKQFYKKLQIHYKGKILVPKKIEKIGDIQVRLKHQPSDSEKLITSFQTYSIYVYTFSDIIYNKNVVLSIKDEFDITSKFNIGKGLLPKNILE